MAMLTNDQKAKAVFASPLVEALLNSVGAELRGLYQFAKDHAPPTDLTMARETLERFDRWHDSAGEFDVTPVVGEPTGYHLENDDTTWKRADELVVGDMIDLADDPIADKDPESMNHLSFECEYATVCEIENESPGCIAIYFEGLDGYGFPPEHLFKFNKHNAEWDDPAAESEGE